MPTQLPAIFTSPDLPIHLRDGNDKYWLIALWIHNKDGFVSINEIAKAFSLSRSMLYRELSKILSCPSHIDACERKHKINHQWHRQIRVTRIDMPPKSKCNNLSFFLHPLIWRELVTRDWKKTNIHRLIDEQ